MRAILIVLAACFSPAALSVCYQIFDSSNRLAWQGDEPPVAMNRLDLDDEVKRIVPGGHLIIVDDQQTTCRPMGSLSAGMTDAGTVAKKKSRQR